jgi:HD-GYP domain-containing protein (c-di-GMP phosphodiesterase class II)
MRIRKRDLLIATVSLGQLACMLTGVAWSAGRLKADVARALQQQVRDEDRPVAGEIGRSGPVGLREGAADGARFQPEAAHKPELSAAAAEGLVRPFYFLGLILSPVVVGFGLLLCVAIADRYEGKLAQVNASLECLVERRTRSLRKTRDAVVFGLAKLAEHRDTDTGAHLERIRGYVAVLARELSRRHHEIDEPFLATLELASTLHDIGKVGVPDAILLKPGRLTPDERRAVQQHPLIGGACLAAICRLLAQDDFLEMARQIALCHHERWDGGGYPVGLAGDQIPLAARIVALADVYDALTSQRVYKPAMGHQQAREAILAGSGTQFDPAIVAAFLAREHDFRRIAAGVPPLPSPARPLAGLPSRVGNSYPAPRSHPVPAHGHPLPVPA